MKFYKLSEDEVSEKYPCCYEEWDKGKGTMVRCGKPSVFSYGAAAANPLCIKHGRFVGAVGAMKSNNSEVKSGELFSRPELPSSTR